MSDGWWNWHCKLHEENAMIIVGIDTPLSHQQLTLMLTDIDLCQRVKASCRDD